jgi:hypothetical protein
MFGSGEEDPALEPALWQAARRREMREIENKIRFIKGSDSPLLTGLGITVESKSSIYQTDGKSKFRMCAF